MKSKIEELKAIYDKGVASVHTCVCSLYHDVCSSHVHAISMFTGCLKSCILLVSNSYLICRIHTLFIRSFC